MGVSNYVFPYKLGTQYLFSSLVRFFYLFILNFRAASSDDTLLTTSSWFKFNIVY
ncbi:hypothetical protein CPB83DRAFT_845323, partial [Crepidotus variabilis]